MIHTTFLNHPWHQLKFLSVSPLTQLVLPEDGPQLALLLARAGVFRPWSPGVRNPDRLPHLRAYLQMPGRGPQSRFGDGTFRIVYAGKTPETCVAEIACHHGRALGDSGEPPGTARIFEALGLKIAGTFVDVRRGHGDLHRRDDHGAAQTFGRTCKSAGEQGIAYRSVRGKGSECLAILDGQAVKSCALKEIIALRWDGERLS